MVLVISMQTLTDLLFVIFSVQIVWQSLDWIIKLESVPEPTLLVLNTHTDIRTQGCLEVNKVVLTEKRSAQRALSPSVAPNQSYQSSVIRLKCIWLEEWKKRRCTVSFWFLSQSAQTQCCQFSCFLLRIMHLVTLLKLRETLRSSIWSCGI